MARTSLYADCKVGVLEMIDAAVRRHARMPTVRELAEHFDVAGATMHAWLRKLEHEGLVVWEPGRHRSLRLTHQATHLLSSQAVP